MKIKRHSTAEHHQVTIADGFENFEENETTFSHMLREAHPFLKQRAFGHAFFDAASKVLPPKKPLTGVVEIGAGMGSLAKNFISAWTKAKPAAKKTGRYTIIDLAPALIATQKKQLKQTAIRPRWKQVDASHLPKNSIPKGTDLIIANEMLADLEVLELRPDGHEPISGSDEDLKSWARVPAARKKICQPWVNQKKRVLYPIGLERLLEAVFDQMENEATFILTEYFSETPGGAFVTHLPGHLEFSLDLDLVMGICRDIGFTVQNVSLMDFLDMRLDHRVISRFGARMLANHVDKDLSASIPHLHAQGKLPVDFYSRSGWLNFWSEFEVLILKKPLYSHPTRHPDVGLVLGNRSETYLMRLHPIQLFRLNQTSQWIWEQLDGKTSIPQIARRMQKVFDIPAKIAESDISELLKQLGLQKLIY